MCAIISSQARAACAATIKSAAPAKVVDAAQPANHEHQRPRSWTPPQSLIAAVGRGAIDAEGYARSVDESPLMVDGPHMHTTQRGELLDEWIHQVSLPVIDLQEAEGMRSRGGLAPGENFAVKHHNLVSRCICQHYRAPQYLCVLIRTPSAVKSRRLVRVRTTSVWIDDAGAASSQCNLTEPRAAATGSGACCLLCTVTVDSSGHGSLPSPFRRPSTSSLRGR
jgi:hypothetical protein